MSISFLLYQHLQGLLMQAPNPTMNKQKSFLYMNILDGFGMVIQHQFGVTGELGVDGMIIILLKVIHEKLTRVASLIRII